MKKRLFLIGIIFCLLFSPAVAGASSGDTCGTCGAGIIWTLESGGALIISGAGAMTDFEYGGAPWYDIASSVLTVIIDEGVTNIGDYAFEDCENLTGITIGKDVTRIGTCAFEGCGALTDVTLGSGVTVIEASAFCYCSALTDITIPENVISVGECAFEGCTGLTGINVSENNAFYCSQNGILFDKNKTALICYPSGKQGSYSVPEYVSYIEKYAFTDCVGLISVSIGSGVTSIGSYAFCGCRSLVKITIPPNVTSIGDYAFERCGALTSVTIPDSIKSIGNYAFSGCNSLLSAALPDSIKNIGYSAFSGCSRLRDVYYGGTEESWNKISIGLYNKPLQNAEIHYSAVIPYTVVSASAANSYNTVSVTSNTAYEGALIILASYSGERLVNVKRKTVDISAGTTSIAFDDFYFDSAADTIKIFAFENAVSARPICVCFSAEI